MKIMLQQIFMALLAALFGSVSTISSTVYTGDAASAKMRRVNWSEASAATIGYYFLDHACPECIIMHNHLYAVVMQPEDGAWRVTHLVNPEPDYHFRLQGSTVSSVDVSADGGYVIIGTKGIDGSEDPHYVLSLEDGSLVQYAYGQLPTSIVPRQEENISRYANEVIIPQDVPKPDTSLYPMDGTTLCYLACTGRGETYGDWRLVFFDTATNESQTLSIQ